MAATAERSVLPAFHKRSVIKGGGKKLKGTRDLSSEHVDMWVLFIMKVSSDG